MKIIGAGVDARSKCSTFACNIPTNLEVALKSIKFRPDKVVFTDSGTYLITNENEAFSYHM